MNTRSSIRILLATLILGMAVSVPLRASAADKADAGTKKHKTHLQVYVNIPSIWSSFLEQNIQDAFTGYVQEVFQRRGFKGQIDEVTDPIYEKKNLPFLTITLIEWRIDRTGTVECTFTATIKNGNQEKNLGILMSNSLFSVGPINDRWEIGNALEDAAHSAIGDMYDRLIKADLVPGLTEKKDK